MITARTRRTVGSLGTVTLGAALVLGVTAMPAAAKSGDVVKRAACSGKTVAKLKLSAEGRKIESEFEVDSNRNGQKWTWSLSRNNTKAASGTAVTKAPSGSFTVRRLLTNGSGRDTVKGLAKNPATGEVCRVTATF
jgi:hypothetical protein